MASATEATGRRSPRSAGGLGLGALLGALFAMVVPAPPARALDSEALHARQLEVGEFDSVRFSGPGLVRLSQGPVARLSVRGSADELAAVEATTRDGTLYIRVADSAPGVTLLLQVADLTELVGDGAGRIVGQGLAFDSLRLVGHGSGSFRLSGVEAEELIVEGRGATRFELTGQVRRQSVQLSGTGAYQAAGLISNSARVSVAGASDVRLWADERLDVEVAGTADIRYAGSPRVEQRITGIASVLRIAQIVI